MRTLRLHEDELRQLAEESGGQYLTLADADRIPDLIEDATRVDPPRRSGPPHELWDRPWVLLTLAGLLTLEWALRRRNHLL